MNTKNRFIAEKKTDPIWSWLYELYSNPLHIMNSIILWLVEDFGGSVEGSDVGVEAYGDVIVGHSNRKWAALLHMGNKQWVSCASEDLWGKGK